MKDYQLKKRDRQMAKPKNPRVPKPAARPKPGNIDGQARNVGVWIFLTLAVVVGIPVAGVFWALSTPAPDPMMAMAANTATSTPFQPATDAPQATQATRTNEPEPTSKPTEKPTREPVVAAPVVIYVEPTAYPTYTPYPSPSPVPTQAETSTPKPTEKSALDLKLEHNVAMQIREDELRMNRIETLSSGPMLFMYALIIVLAIIWMIPRRWDKARRSQSKTETSQEIRGRKAPERTPPARSAGYPDIMEILERSIQRYSETSSTLVGWRYLNGIDPAWTGPRWDKALKLMDELGLNTIRQAGVGSYLSKTNLRGARIYIIKALHPLPHHSPTARGERCFSLEQEQEQNN